MATTIHAAWNSEHLYFQFSAPYTELYVNEDWSNDRSTYGLWERDVVEVFLRPDISSVYFEFEVSPLAQWLDVLIREPRKDVDFSWASGMKVQCELDSAKRQWISRLTVPLAPMRNALKTDLVLKAGVIWRANLFRVSGAEPARHYLAWQPTFTPAPDFHVPSAFGNLIFVE